MVGVPGDDPGGLAVLLAQTLLIGALLVEWRGRIGAEAEIREAERRYRTVADFTHDWEYWRRPDGSFAYVSPSCRRTTGHEAAEFERRPALLDEIVLEDDRPLWSAHAEKTRVGGGPSQLEFRIRTADGRVRWIDHVCSPVTGGPGRSSACAGRTGTSPTRSTRKSELRRALAEIQRLRDRLEVDNTYLREQVEPGAGTRWASSAAATCCTTSSPACSRWRPRRARCSCRARRASARSSSPARSTT